MRAAFLSQQAGPESLILGELSPPRPAEGEVLIKVHATAVTPTEFGWFPTFRTRTGEPRPFPIVPSHEFAGVIAESGGGPHGWKVGDPVLGMNDWFCNGALAEYCIAPTTAVALKPRSLPDDEAAVVPISALTAWQGLFDRCSLKAGERVLIHGASGAVGVFAVQLARWKGTYVISTASSRNLDFVAGLGADEVLDYKVTRFENVARDIDVVFDTVGGETFERSWSVLNPTGRLVTIVSQSEVVNEPRARTII